MLKLTDFKNKKVLIMGLGLHGGGIGTAAFFSRLGSQVIVTDLKTKRELAPSLIKLRHFKNITCHLGGHRPADFHRTDYVIKGPGVPENSKFLKIAKRAGVPILSDVEIFFLTCPAPIIGITGTKGKSTATRLLGQFLKRGLKKRIWVGGNIRKSVLEFLPRVKKGDLVILELSSFQLDSLKNQRLSPHIAVITNIFPDHLNRYPSFAAYISSKANIFRFQKPGDALFINRRDRLLKHLAKSAKSRVISFGPKRIGRGFASALPKNLPDYYLPNIAAAVAISRRLGVGNSAIQSALKHFRGLEGRMQLVRKIRGIGFINDTAATNPGAAELAIIAVKKRIGQGGLHVIAGGYDKRLPVRNFVRALRRNAATIIFLPGTATERLKAQIPKSKTPARLRLNEVQAGGPIPKIFKTKSMTAAVRIGYHNARRGDVVLLSPGAASFGLFQHEFDRGEKFNQAAKRLR